MVGGQRDRTNEDGAATEELARLEAVDVVGELHREPDQRDLVFNHPVSLRAMSLKWFFRRYPHSKNNKIELN